MSFNKIARRTKIKKSVRKRVFGTPEKPRLSVFRSNTHISAQIIDDVAGKTLASASSQLKDVTEKKGTKKEKAGMVGKILAEKAKSAGIETVVFDRNGFLYHGRIKSLADGAREGGLKF